MTNLIPDGMLKVLSEPVRKISGLHRLTREAIANAPGGINGVIDYVYDPVGNRQSRTSSVTGIANQTFGYDANDRLTNDIYDNNGNTTLGHLDGSVQPVIDSYDYENHLTQRTGGTGSNVTLAYDGDGNKVRETANGQTITYLIDNQNPTGYTQVVEELLNGSVFRRYTFGHDLISENQLIASVWSPSFYGYDGHGSVRLLTNGAGLVTDTYNYDAFGQLIQSTGSTPNDYRYSGEQLDPNLGLYYLRARYLNAANGRFWTMDSYRGQNSDPASLHKYVYANADPVNRTDPSGFFVTSGEGVVTVSIQAQIAVAAYLAATIFQTAVAYVDYANEQTDIRDIESVVAGASTTGITQSEFDALDRRIGIQTPRNRARSIYLHYSFERYATEFLSGLRPISWGTRTVYRTGWSAKLSLALKQEDIQDAIYIVWPKTLFGPLGPTIVNPDIDVLGRYLPGGGQQWFYPNGSGGFATVFGPIHIPTGEAP